MNHIKFQLVIIASFITALPNLSFASSTIEGTTKIGGQVAQLEKKVQEYSIGLSASRIIYREGSRGAMIFAENPNDYPVLVQSEVSFSEEANKGGDELPSFIVTPPLFRLEPGARSAIKVLKTSDAVASDKEELYWFCAMAIPPEKDSVWDEREAKSGKSNSAVLDIKIRTNRCIKLIERPATLNEQPEGVISSVVWSVKGDEILAYNPTGYYINLKSISFGSKSIDAPDFIPPKGERSYKLPSGVKVKPLDIMTFVIINDLGGESGPYKAKIM